MQGELVSRPFRAEDYDAVLRLWQQADGVEVAEGDDRAGIAGYLTRNPDLSRVAECGGVIVAAVLCGQDGRRGLIYHLAVASTMRGRGIGRRLVSECINGLKACGIKRALILVARDNPEGQRFWATQGFEEISRAVAFGIDVE